MSVADPLIAHSKKFIVWLSIFHVVTLSSPHCLEPKYRTVVKFMAEDSEADFGFTDADSNTALHYLMRNERILEMKSFIQDRSHSYFTSFKVTY